MRLSLHCSGHVLTLSLLAISCFVPIQAVAEAPPDEAKQAAKDPHYYFPKKIHNYFRGMDVISAPGEAGEVWPDQLLDQKPRPERQLIDPVSTDAEILGRNTWMVWCGGNEAFWDWLANNSHGSLDFLKLIDSRNRAHRWRDAGLVNEPGMREVVEADEFGLWLDEPDAPKQRTYRKKVIDDAFHSGRRVETPAPANSGGDGNAYDRDEYDPEIPPAHIYGLSSGVVGLRLFPNPRFDEAARKKWDVDRYYTDSDYYEDPKLVRPYRVGMACAFCHASAHPLNPPQNPANPRWDNLSASIGSQYLRVRAVFGNMLRKREFSYHLLDSQPPGTIDTSLIPSDHINNTNTMNAIFGVPQRVVRSFENPREKLAKPAAEMPSLWPDPREAPQEYKNLIPSLLDSNSNPRYVPRILLAGEDSIGAYGALARVYLNIGTYHEQWIRLHEPLTGFLPPAGATEADRQAWRTQLPFKIKDCEDNSVYWQATQLRIGALRDYFLRITPTMPLADANAQDAGRPRIDVSRFAHGRQVFAKQCIVCHSSIQPETDSRIFVDGDTTDYESRHEAIIASRKEMIAEWEKNGEVWDHDPGQWLRDPGYQNWATKVVETPGFWRQNFLSTDMRLPVNYIGTNSGRAMATNAMNGHMWEDFSSDSFRSLPSVGSISYFNPYTQQNELFTGRQPVTGDAPAGGGGPGFYRPASLMSVWATAPLLHNNSLGHFNNDPSVAGRLAAFDDAIHQLLYLERRAANTDYASSEQLARDHGLIWRTPCETYLRIPAKYVPADLRRLPLPGWLLDWSERFNGVMGPWRAVPTVALFLIAAVILGVSSGRMRRARFWRYGAYGLALLGLIVGFVAYLETGGFGDLQIGPIPAGTPVDLLANINPDAPRDELKAALRTVIEGLTEIETRRLEGEDREAVMRTKVAPALMHVSKCPDFVMDKGHYYPWFADMTSDDKEAVIELLKTF